MNEKMKIIWLRKKKKSRKFFLMKRKETEVRIEKISKKNNIDKKKVEVEHR